MFETHGERSEGSPQYKASISPHINHPSIGMSVMSPKRSIRPHRAFVACTHCRKRKIRCIATTILDGIWKPCTRCSLKGLKCEYLSLDYSGATPPTPVACCNCRESKIKCSTVTDGDCTRPCTNCSQRNILCVSPAMGGRYTPFPAATPPGHIRDLHRHSSRQAPQRSASCPQGLAFHTTTHHYHQDVWSPTPIRPLSAGIIDLLHQSSLAYVLPMSSALPPPIRSPHVRPASHPSYDRTPDPPQDPFASMEQQYQPASTLEELFTTLEDLFDPNLFGMDLDYSSLFSAESIQSYE
ncbi:hypothetical protein C8F04DRAFT_126817 [Mycena alexandri]|uniref:Zn(2)-C6 fungal-type domain-containing protein n=1 Tax=Mycena alexandri TaxID=1745969 RepID=A0AAD6SDV1_9AGAR|nr:hypothetical protein C8F04DRAFT_126817 [Mycena alexandri]